MHGNYNSNKNNPMDDGSHTPQRSYIDEELLKPLCIATFITNHPCTLCWLIVILMFIVGYIDYLVFELSPQESRTWFVEDSKYATEYDAWTLAEEELNNHGGDDIVTQPQTEEGLYLTSYFLFELESYDKEIDENNPNATNYWILTPENVQTILKYEEMITKNDEWIDSYCYVIDTTTYDCQYVSLARDIAQRWDYNFSS